MPDRCLLQRFGYEGYFFTLLGIIPYFGPFHKDRQVVFCVKYLQCFWCYLHKI